jgi:hypothetical protein
MHIPPPPQTPVPVVWRRRIFVLAGLLLLSGCANGDFGEVRPFLVTDGIHDWVGPAAIAGTKAKPSSFELTDDERELRDLAYPLIEPPYDRQKWYSVAGEYGLIARDRSHTFDRTAYASQLLSNRYRSPSARYSHLIDDIRNDTTRLPQFFETATRVLDIDRKRKISLTYISDLSQAERHEALRRINVNAAIVAWVRSKLDQRAASYKFALERLVIMTPSQQAVETERALNHLRAGIAYYRGHSAPSWGREQSLASSR